MTEDSAKIGQKVVILGGGLVGCEAAVHLAQAGKDVTNIEMQEEVAIDANERHRPILMELLLEITKIETRLKAVRVNDEGLVCFDERAFGCGS
jgi:NADPH-dependent 2,4-dienoyl-CoA reductase/sulfur reductase-like enzyme